MIEIKQYYLTKNDCYKKGTKHTPIGIMVHSTGANNPYLKRYIGPDDGILGYNKYNNHWNQPGVEACVHAFIGKDQFDNVRIYQTLPWTMAGWHSGSGYKGYLQNANNTGYIGFEICEDNLKDKEYFETVYNLAIDLCVYLVKEFPTIKIENIIGHYEGYQKGIASNHGDPRHWFSKYGKSMDDFRAEVKKRLEKEKNETPSPSKPIDEIYRVRKTWEDAKSQLGAYSILENAKKIVDENPDYKVFNSDGEVVYEAKKEQSSPSPYIPETKTYAVVKDIPGYVNANDAKNRTNKKTTVKKGQYYIYKEFDKDIINVSLKKDVAGSWINKNDNVEDKKPEQPKPNQPKNKENLTIDGIWGTETTKALQRALGTTVDGIISGQYKNNITSTIPSVQFGTGGSQVIKALQKKLGIKQDGYIGTETVKALQKYLGTPVDGVISKPSQMVKALQKRLNEGTF